ncbi:MAG: hypothetical protein JOZ81_26440, partial [Chloroflexi bacterium]|nr:hypothetical protein [Chloroflexota bacterium]
MPRPPKLTPERQERVLAAIGAGATRKAAASYAGVDESTLYRWLKRNASFASLLRAREDEVEVRACAEIQQAASADWRAAAWWLERRRPADYGRTDRVDLNVRL